MVDAHVNHFSAVHKRITDKHMLHHLQIKKIVDQTHELQKIDHEFQIRIWMNCPIEFSNEN